MIRGMILAVSLLAALPAFAQEPMPPDARKLIAIALDLYRDAGQLNAQGKFDEAEVKARQAHKIFQTLYPVSKFPEGHPVVALSLHNLGGLLHQMGRSEKAILLFRECLDMKQRLYPVEKYPEGHSDLVDSLNGMGGALNATARPEQAATFFQQGLDMNRKLYPEAKYPHGHPELALSLNLMGFVNLSLGRPETAVNYFQQSLSMRRLHYPVAKYPNGHPDLAISLGNLGVAYQAMGQADKAVDFCRQSLEMHRHIYRVDKFPDGHPSLATSLNNLGGALKSIGQAEKAESYFQQCLDMRRKLYPVAKYPHGHPELAHILNNVAYSLWETGKLEKAAELCLESLEMNRKLYPAAKYPDGHPQLARSLNNIGSVLQVVDGAEKAALYFQQSLEMNQKLYPAANYPEGHPDLALSLNNLGAAFLSLGHREKATNLLGQSLEVRQRYVRRELLTAPESAAFDLIAAQPWFCDSYLSATRSPLHMEESYRRVASSRAMVTRTLAQRHANARAAGTEIAGKLDSLKGIRQRIEQLMLDSRLNKDERDQMLVKYADQRDALERELVEAIPALQRWKELDRLGPDDLVKALPAEAVFLDLIAYTRFDFHEGRPKRTPCYVAFVLAKDRAIKRIELDEAQPINAAVTMWRTALMDRRTDSGTAVLKERIWDKLAPHIPPGTKTLYLAPDGDLARLPWAALPIGRGRVLLEDYAVAMVPHGIFLLDQLKFGRMPAGPDSLLALGGIDYGPGTWPALPGTKTEVTAISTIAPGERLNITGTEAAPDKLKELLPKARYAHLATHGEFQADALTAERKRAAAALAAHHLGDDSRKIAAKNPLGYVGLVLSNGEVLTGLGIVDLPLENLRLVTLSACETGLGELTAGEGVFGLTRAFHLAGCPNVVASLWKVNDAATAALMAKFYHEMWVNKKPPIEALREAQLTIYYHPELIPDLAGERGPVRVKESVRVRAGSVSDGEQKRADTKLWAAFVLSGVGK